MNVNMVIGDSILRKNIYHIGRLANTLSHADASDHLHLPYHDRYEVTEKRLLLDSV